MVRDIISDGWFKLGYVEDRVNHMDRVWKV